jgi:hypothetical protein
MGFCHPTQVVTYEKPSVMKRRELLSLALLSVFSGCLDRDSQSDARLDWIRVTNGHGVEESHEISVSVTEGETVVFEETYIVNSEPEYDTEHEQSPVDEPGKYVVHATTDGGMEAEIETTQHIEEENECIGVHFEIVSENEFDAWTRSKCLSENP